VRARRGAVAIALALGLAACGRSGPPLPAAPLQIRGGVVIEPPEIAIGETADVEIAVVTPPDHQLEPVEAPASLEGLWILAAEPLPTERSGNRWVHRVRFRVRARATGEIAWPAQTAYVTTPAGERVPVPLASRPIRVVEVTEEFPGRREPFSWREPRAEGQARRFLLPAAFGAVSVLAVLGLAGLVRRARRAEAGGDAAPGPAEPTAARRAEADLEAAAARLELDPVGAAHAASLALRRFVLERTGAPAHVSTTEEMRELEPPFLLARRWEELLQRLGALDALRFRALALAGEEGRHALRREIRAARILVDTGAPEGGP
jgi:Prokaryotic lipoprotein-attachment site